MMKIQTITISKEYKKGLPEFSNVTASCSVTIVLQEGEKPNLAPIWESINKNIKEQLVAYESLH